ncbi:MAG: acyl-CoA dehydrogenase family protein [Spirochaetales bacterium]|nr:acyl-CoA dehydrogenase family protein [Spirochaetales bacterium]
MMDRDNFEKLMTEVKDFVNNKVRPFAGKFEEEEAVPLSLIKEMAERKYLAAPFPAEIGGLELDQVQYGLLTHEIGKGCPSVRALLTVHTSLVGQTLLRMANQEQKDKWLPLLAKGEKIAAFGLTEPDVGTDAKSVQTRYEKQGDHFVITGRKKWITYGHLADVFVIIARNEENVSAFLVERDRENLRTTPIKGLLASRAAYIAEIELNAVRVPEENVIGNLGQGFSYIVNTALDYGRYSIAWAGVSLAEAALEEMVKYARNRSQFGQKLYKFQLIHEMIANAVTKVQTAKSICLQAGEQRNNNADEAIMTTTIAKYYSSKIAMEVATDAVQLHGGNGCCNQYPVERLFREAKIFEIIEGTSQIQQEIISMYGLKKYNRK